MLVTSLARRTFSSEHATSDSLGPYSAETINVANNLGLPVSNIYICAGVGVSTDRETPAAPPSSG